MERNPFAINFGIMPLQYIERDLIKDEILAEITADRVQNSCFMLTGVRGTGKTVTLTAIENELRDDNEWIVIGLSTDRDMLQSLTAKLYDSNDFIKEFVATELNLSKFGIGINIESMPPAADIESSLEKILKEIKRKNKRLLVTVDEVDNTISMRQFASTFQLLIRQELPIFLIMAGLYENIHNLENENALTFLYRTPKYEMTPLNISLIQNKYMKVFNVNHEIAFEMATITKGYPFAYQVLGKYIWEDSNHSLSDEVLLKFDAAMSQYVYLKIWSELSAMDKWYMSYIANKTQMEISELLEITKKKKNEFSQYRERLKNKGLINVEERGMIKLVLPRFDVFVKNQL